MYHQRTWILVQMNGKIVSYVCCYVAAQVLLVQLLNFQYSETHTVAFTRREKISVNMESSYFLLNADVQ